MKPYSIDLREKIVHSVRKGVSKKERDRPQRFGVDRSTLKRYVNQLDESGSLAPKKRPGSRPKLDEESAIMRLLKEDLVEARPRVTHRQRSEFLAIVVRGVEVSEATVCRAIKRLLGQSRKKELRQRARGMSGSEGALANREARHPRSY